MIIRNMLIPLNEYYLKCHGNYPHIIIIKMIITEESRCGFLTRKITMVAALLYKDGWKWEVTDR